MKNTRIILILFLFLLVFSSISTALLEQVPFWKLVGNWLTYDGNVKINGNLSIDGDFVNVTVVDYNVTGNMDVDGGITANDFLGGNFIGDSINVTSNSEINGTYFKNGNVGIGTTSPNQRLAVMGDVLINSSNINAFNIINTSGSSMLFLNGSNGKVGIGTSNPGATLEINISATGNKGLIIKKRPGQVANLFETQQSDGDTNFIINKDGQINSRVFTDGTRAYQFRKSTGGDVVVIDTSNIRLGIGRTPEDNLDVYTTGGTSLVRNTAASGTNSFVMGFRQGVGGIIGTTTGNAFAFIEGDVEKMRLSSGNLGIGTTAPTEKLSVMGNVSLNNTLYVTENGRVGIGTTAPSHKLNVVGDTNITENVYGNGNWSITLPHGFLCAHNDSGDPFPFGVQNEFYNFTMDEFDAVGFTRTADGNGLIAQIAGEYDGSYHASGSGDANSIYKSRLAVNGEGNNCSIAFFRTSNVNDVITMSGGGQFSLEIGDIVTLQIADLTGTSTGKRYSSEFRLTRKGHIH